MNKFLTVAFAAILFSTTALAKDKKVVIELPKTITVTCSDRVQPGTVVLSNPPKFSCADYNVVKRVIGTGITIGPDTRVSHILRAIRRVEKPTRRTPTTTVATNDNWKDIRPTDNRPQSYWQDGYRKGAWQPLDDFDKRFPGINRNAKFFVSDTSSCRGWVNIQKILNGECKEVKVRVQ